jgi:hypothetical protein
MNFKGDLNIGRNWKRVKFVWFKWQQADHQCLVEIWKINWIIGSSLIAKTSLHTQNRPMGLNLGFNEKDYKLVWAGMSDMSSYCVVSLLHSMVNCFGLPYANLFLVSSIAFRSSEYLQDNLGKILENIILLPRRDYKLVWAGMSGMSSYCVVCLLHSMVNCFEWLHGNFSVSKEGFLPIL